MKTGDESLTARDKLVSLAYEPSRPNPQNKAAPSKSAPKQIDASVRGGVCRSVTAVADAGVCARTRAAVRVTQLFWDGQNCAMRPWARNADKRSL
jgi:hypothetical protein